jgi:signal transduction histidine kinase
MFPAAEARAIGLRLQSPSNVPRVLGDRDRLLQVFVNLLDNACKYAKTGGEALVSFALDKQHVRVSIQDDGRGIAVEDLPHIFEPLYRSSDVRDTPGTGMGLTIVRTILDQHGAAIDVQSAPGCGTTVSFDLPFVQDGRV